MAHYDIFRHHLVMKFPAYGHALWDPNHGNLYPAATSAIFVKANSTVSSMFYYLQKINPMKTSKHINIGMLSPNNFCSAKVTSIPNSEVLAKGPDDIPSVTFSCPRKEGAVLYLPVTAKGENTVASADFGKWLIKHIDCWFARARRLGLEIDRMEDIILVTGTHRTRSCTNVAFPGGQEDAQASFGARVDHNGAINWQFSHERNRGAVLNCGHDGKDLPEDQCVFIRGFRATRKFKILPPRLKGAAGPNPDLEEYDEEPDAELMPITELPEYRDPLHLLLEYIAEEAPPDCDMALVHDDDLARLDGICDISTLDGLQSDVMLCHIRSLQPAVHSARIAAELIQNPLG
ncbi:hypothetical protein EI94DRAFT_1811875 [Lactarius quietus]|nr:hypothetical protein EI94DRAFT_1811875 [Lactarius quietus]